MIYLTWEFAQHSVFRKFLQERFVLQHLSPILGIAIAKIEVKALKQRAILLKLVRIKLVGIKLVQLSWARTGAGQHQPANLRFG